LKIIAFLVTIKLVISPVGYINHSVTQLAASTSSRRAGVVGMLQAILQAILQGASPVGYFLKIIKGIVSVGCYACRAFCSRFLGIVLAACRALRLWVLGALGALGSLRTRRPLGGLRLPRLWLVRELWLGVLRVLSGRVCAVGED
jgi:hypothetical protein